MSEWSEVPLGDVLTLQRGFDLPKNSRKPGPYPVISSSGFTGSHDEFKVDPPGVVIGRYGSLGSVHWVEEPFWPHNTSLWVKDFKGNDERFVFYLLQTVRSDGSSASAVPGVNRNHLHRLEVLLPDVRTQTRIASILETFDELIDINERRISLLEDLARSLYREWFVHFRFPGHEGVEIVDSGIGQVPDGWTQSHVESLAAQLSRGISPKYGDEGIWTVVNQRCIRDHKVNMDLARRHVGKVPEAKRLQLGDVLINSTGVGTLGRVAVFMEEANSTTADSHVTIVRAKSNELKLWLGLNIMSREIELQDLGTGSTGQTELGRAVVGGLPAVIPPRSVIDDFNEVIWPILNEIPSLVDSCRLLAATRDLLLPRLVTGKLDLSEVDLGILTPVEPV